MASIREYHPADREACRQLWVDLTQHHRDIYGTDAIGGEIPGDLFDEHLSAVGPGNIWVADEGGEVVGMTGLIVDGTDGEVEPMIVAPAHRGSGIGRALLEHVVTVARGRGLRTLSARPVGRNSGAIATFHDAGFDVLGHIELMLDIAGDRIWNEGETLAGREFRV
jgi:GNAT superfamily N-acetyltransferase